MRGMDIISEAIISKEKCMLTDLKSGMFKEEYESLFRGQLSGMQICINILNNERAIMEMKNIMEEALKP